MERYKILSQTIKEKSNKLRYSSSFYPNIPLRGSDVYIYSKSGQRLDILAFQYYSDPRYWWIIARANNLGKGTLLVPPGKRLRIPYPINEITISQVIQENK